MTSDTINTISESEDLEFSEMPSEELTFVPPPFGGFQPNPPNVPGGRPPSGPPPNFIPSKNAKGVQGFNLATPAISANSIRFCLRRFTYIWETNGRAYWAFLLNVDRVSVSGFRWLGRNWVFFGVNLRRIDSFFCSRTEEENRDQNIDSISINKEYTQDRINEVYSRILTEISVPDDDKNYNYRIILEVKYPYNLDEDIKDTIIDCATNCEYEVLDIVNNSRSIINYLTPLEIFNLSTTSISSALNRFSNKFSLALKSIPSLENIYSTIHYSIRQDKIIN